VDGRNGVKDFDVWTFFSDDGRSPKYPARRRGVAKFEGSRFRESTGRVDLLGRTLEAPPGTDPVGAVQRYLRASTTSTAHHLGNKAVVVLDPADRRGEVIWPMPATKTHLRPAP
jgi:hypothetical protein